MVHGHFQPWTDLDPWPLSTMGSQEEVRVKRWGPSNSDVDLDGGPVGPNSDDGLKADIGPWADVGPWAVVKVEDR